MDKKLNYKRYENVWSNSSRSSHCSQYFQDFSFWNNPICWVWCVVDGILNNSHIHMLAEFRVPDFIKTIRILRQRFKVRFKTNILWEKFNTLFSTNCKNYPTIKKWNHDDSWVVVISSFQIKIVCKPNR